MIPIRNIKKRRQLLLLCRVFWERFILLTCYRLGGAISRRRCRQKIFLCKVQPVAMAAILISCRSQASSDTKATISGCIQLEAERLCVEVFVLWQINMIRYFAFLMTFISVCSSQLVLSIKDLLISLVFLLSIFSKMTLWNLMMFLKILKSSNFCQQSTLNIELGISNHKLPPFGLSACLLGN